ncbi:MAG TPA: DUF928 domain-containing protein [Geminicoccaceae bacterium]|nr:DUF928 domain-containing protein [Geminicoccaceae bacterium]
MQGYRSTGHRRRRLGGVVVASLLTLINTFAVAQQAADSKPSATKSSALETLVYVPHDYDAPEVTEAGGVRAASQVEAKLPSLLVLAPPKLAATLSAQPRLYWYLSGPSTAPLRLTLLDFEGTSPEPLLELALDTAPAEGVYSASLAEHDVRLEPGRLYEWSVALEVDQEGYSNESVAKTIMAAKEADPALLAQIADAPALARVEALAAAGYWYDAIDVIAQQIAADDSSQPWRELRAKLLEQVGLQAVATFERGGGTLDSPDR